MDGQKTAGDSHNDTLPLKPGQTVRPGQKELPEPVDPADKSAGRIEQRPPEPAEEQKPAQATPTPSIEIPQVAMAEETPLPPEPVTQPVPPKQPEVSRLPQPEPVLQAAPTVPPMQEQTPPPQPSSEEFAAQYPPETDTYDDVPEGTVMWTASEFIAHRKNGGWYALLTLGTIALSTLTWLLTRDYLSTGVIFIAGLLLGAYAGHTPRQLHYAVDPSGLTIEARHYPFNDFRSFTIVRGAAIPNIVLYPLSRFGVPVSVFYAPEDEQQILDLISQRVPYEERGRDVVDSLMRKIRF